MSNLPSVRPAPPSGTPAADSTFVRTFIPRGATWIKRPIGYRSRSESGKLQVRTVSEYGATWTETYSLMECVPFSSGNAQSGGIEWMNYIDTLCSKSIPVMVQHPHASGTMRCIVADYTAPEAGPDEFYIGMKITFLEIAP